jgi:hypothetical protein
VRRAVERATCEEGSEKTSRSSRVVIVTSRDIDDLDLTERRVDFSAFLSIDENSDEAARDAMNRFRTGSTLVSDESTIGHHV